MNKVKQVGCCSVCDVLIREVNEEGEFGKPIPGSRRAYVVLLSGNLCFYSLCANCELTPDNMPMVFRKAVSSMKEQTTTAWREPHGLKHRTPKQKESHRKMLWMFVQDIPVGVLGMRDWAGIE